MKASNYKYGCSLSCLVYNIRQHVEEFNIEGIIVPEMLNTSVIYAGLLKDGYITKNSESWSVYDFRTTEKGKSIGISRVQRKDGGVKMMLGIRAVEIVVRNIKNGRYLLEKGG